mmetsp:Transcript_37582/g.94906  ORF Transcript_37582/g.94906 Transcript_37582/m.94906 type:complete len:111 (+) Transcript_37582:2445-2777(+)
MLITSQLKSRQATHSRSQLSAQLMQNHVMLSSSQTRKLLHGNHAASCAQPCTHHPPPASQCPPTAVAKHACMCGIMPEASKHNCCCHPTLKQASIPTFRGRCTEQATLLG